MFSNHNICPISPVCMLKNVLNKALTSFLHVLNGYTLADISQNKGVLAQFIGTYPEVSVDLKDQIGKNLFI